MCSIRFMFTLGTRNMRTESSFLIFRVAFPPRTTGRRLTGWRRRRWNATWRVRGVWMLVDLDLARIDPAPKRVNISLPGSLLSQIDDYAQARHLSRSGFLAKAAQEAMSSE